MSRTRILLYSLPLVALLSACSGGGGSQSALPADPASVSQPTQATQPSDLSQAADPSAAAAQQQEAAAATAATTPTDTTQSLSTESAATASSSVPAHIQTWAKDLYWSAGALGTSAQAKEYLTYAQGGLGNSKALTDCRGGGCQSVFYFDPHSFYDTDTAACRISGPSVKSILSHATESWYVHLLGYRDSAHRVHGSYKQSCNGREVTIPVYALNTLDSGVLDYYKQYFETTAAGWNHFFMDDTSGQVLSQFYGAGGGFCWNARNHYCTSTEEMRNDAAVVSEHRSLANAIPISGFFNGVNIADGRMNDLDVLESSSHFIGAICEDCVVNSGTFRPSMYATVLNVMAQLDQSHGAFVELNHGENANGSAAQIAQRAITTAMAWLGYSEGHTVVYPDLEANTERLAIFPENSIYPSSPIETMSTGATNIEVSPGVYRREFRSCYYNRSAIGPCAAIVNATGRDVTVSSAWLHESYGHEVQMIGGDIPAGGRVSLTGVRFYPNRTYIAPSQGMMIVR